MGSTAGALFAKVEPPISYQRIGKREGGGAKGEAEDKEAEEIRRERNRREGHYI